MSARKCVVLPLLSCGLDDVRSTSCWFVQQKALVCTAGLAANAASHVTGWQENFNSSGRKPSTRILQPNETIWPEVLKTKPSVLPSRGHAVSKQLRRLSASPASGAIPPTTAAMRPFMLDVEHRTHKRLATGQDSHLPLRKRQRMMQGFSDLRRLQRFTSVYFLSEACLVRLPPLSPPSPFTISEPQPLGKQLRGAPQHQRSIARCGARKFR